MRHLALIFFTRLQSARQLDGPGSISATRPQVATRPAGSGAVEPLRMRHRVTKALQSDNLIWRSFFQWACWLQLDRARAKLELKMITNRERDERSAI